MSTWRKYAGPAGRWTDEAYADADAYLAHRAELVCTLGPALAPGDVVLDLACGDGGLGDFLPEQRYIGVDASPEMVAAAKKRGRDVIEADMNDFEPSERPRATTMFRAVYYARDRRALLTRIAGYTDTKVVFDLNPRQYSLREVRDDLVAAGFDNMRARPFFMPQSRSLGRPAARLLRVLEQTGFIARAVLRFRFTYLVAAWRSTDSR
ncbi:MAG: Methionine biosynthesis protein MetW [Gaiellaceae bacterium]|nr:Methionine biosynthesis protein MetW [Gaiellaceae bacterium]